MGNYRIFAEPRGTAFVGQTTVFGLQRLDCKAYYLQDLKVTWMCLYDYSYETLKERKKIAQRLDVFSSFKEGMEKKVPRRKSNILSKEKSLICSQLEMYKYTWLAAGPYRIVCNITLPNGTKEVLEYKQKVMEKYEPIPFTEESREDPFVFYHNLTLQIKLIRQLEKQQRLSEDDEEEYQERMDTLDELAEKLKKLLLKIPMDCRDNIVTVYTKHLIYRKGPYEINEFVVPHPHETILRVCYFYREDDRGFKVYLLDWTSPLQQGFCGVRIGEGITIKEALKNAIEVWTTHNRYPPGFIRGKTSYRTPEEEYGELLINAYLIDFETSGKTRLDKWISVLKFINMVGTIISAIALAVTPIPGARIASGLLWTSVVSAAGATAAVLSITQRYNEGYSNWTDDSQDCLTILSSAFGIGTTKWGARVFTFANMSSNMVQKIGFWGQITADGMQGILMNIDIYNQFNKLLDNKTMPADIKLNKMIELITQGVLDNIINVINVRGNIKNLKQLYKVGDMHMPSSTSEADNFKIGENKSGVNKVIDVSIPTETNNSRSSANLSKSSIKNKQSSSIEKNNKINKINLENVDLSNTSSTLSNETIQDVVDGKLYNNESSTLKSMNYLYNSIKDKLNDKPTILTYKFTGENQTKNYSAILPSKEAFDHILSGIVVPNEGYLEKLLQKNIENGKSFSRIKENGYIEKNSNELDVSKGKSNSNQTETKATIHTNTGKQQPKQSGEEKLKNDLSTLEKTQEPIDIYKKGTSALTRCDDLGIESQTCFSNLPSMYKQFQKEGIIESIDDHYFKIIDPKKYMQNLKKAYIDTSDLYPDVNTKMHSETEKLVYDVILKNEKFNIIDGMPGTNAETLSTNNIYHQLTDLGADISSKQIQISKIHLTKS